MEGIDFKELFNTYWDVIEACIEMQDDYLGKGENAPRIAPDSVGNVINKLIKARKKYPIKRVVEWQ